MEFGFASAIPVGMLLAAQLQVGRFDFGMPGLLVDAEHFPPPAALLRRRQHVEPGEGALEDFGAAVALNGAQRFQRGRDRGDVVGDPVVVVDRHASRLLADLPVDRNTGILRFALTAVRQAIPAKFQVRADDRAVARTDAPQLVVHTINGFGNADALGAASEARRTAVAVMHAAPANRPVEREGGNWGFHGFIRRG